MAAKIAAFFKTAKRNLLKDVKGFEKVRFTSYICTKTSENNKT